MDETKIPASGYFWQTLIVALVVVFIVGLAATFVTVTRKGSPVVDVDYYARGLHYGSDRGRERSGEQQGWRLETSMGKGVLEVRVRDGQGAPVGGGLLILTLAERPDANKKGEAYAWANGTPLIGLEQGPGVYAVTVPRQQPGDRQGKLAFTRGDAMLAEKVVILQ